MRTISREKLPYCFKSHSEWGKDNDLGGALCKVKLPAKKGSKACISCSFRENRHYIE